MTKTASHEVTKDKPIERTSPDYITLEGEVIEAIVMLEVVRRTLGHLTENMNPQCMLTENDLNAICGAKRVIEHIAENLDKATKCSTAYRKAQP